MGLKESLQSAWSSRNPGKVIELKKLFNAASKKNWMREVGIVDTEKNWQWKYVKKGDLPIVEHNFNFKTYHRCYEQIPKVFRSINTRANFAVQGGFNLIGNEADCDKLWTWMSKVNYDMYQLTFAKLGYIDGNVWIEVRGELDKTTLQILPPETMRVAREETGELLGHVQFFENKVYESWLKSKNNFDHMVHLKWNDLGVSPYGFSEIRPNLATLEDKLDAEAVLPEIIKFHADNRIVWLLGMPERPYNKTQQEEWKSGLENRVVAGDIACGGDVKPVVIQPQRGVGEIMNLINHIEAQLDTGLNNPQNLIEGGEGGQRSISLESLERDVKTMQDTLTQVNYLIFAKVLGKKEVPEIKWNPMSQELELRQSRTIRQLIGDGKSPPVIDINEARAKLGLAPKNLESDAMKMAKMQSAPSQNIGG